MAANAKEIIQTWDRLNNAAATFKYRWELLAKYIQPTRTSMWSPEQELSGQSQTNDLYDSTGVTVAETFASFIFGNVINPATKWRRLAIRDKQLMALDDVREWLDECNDLMMAAVGASNFYLQAYEMLIDYGGFGTGCKLIEEKGQDKNQRAAAGFRGFSYTTTQIGHFFIDENANHEVDTLYRSFFLSAAAIEREFPNGSYSDGLKQALTREREKRFQIIHAIYPRPYEEQKSKAARDMPWASCWVEKEAKAGAGVLRESGYPEFPAVVPRYQQSVNEVFGRSPGFTALPDMLTLNNVKRKSFESWDMAIWPPVLGRSDSDVSVLQLTPKGYTTVKTPPGMSPNQVLQHFETGTKWDITQLKEEELRKSIEGVYHMDAIKSLLSLEREMTATEYVKRLELVHKLLGPVWGRMTHEWLNRQTDREFNMMMERGALPSPPDSLIEAATQAAATGNDAGIKIDVEYEGPLAKAQRSGEVESVMFFVQDVGILAALDENVKDWVDTDKTAKLISEIRGVPGVALRSDDEVAALREGRRQAQEEQTMKEDLMGAADAANKLAPVIKAAQETGQAI
jgi:hypothetical protein